MTCAVAKKRSKALMIDASDWLSFLEPIQFQRSCRAYVWSCMALVKVARRMHGLACHMQRQSFLVERECWRWKEETVKEASWNIFPDPSWKVITKTRWGPHKWFLSQSLFLDIWIMVYELQDAIYGWLVMLVKIDGPLFLDIGRFLFLDYRAKNRTVKYY